MCWWWFRSLPGSSSSFLADPWPQLRCPSPLPTVISCDETEEGQSLHSSQQSQEAPHDDGGKVEEAPPPPKAEREGGVIQSTHPNYHLFFYPQGDEVGMKL